MAKKFDLEESFQALDDIINSLQTGELSLEESFKQYEAGMKLVKNCNQAIDKVEKKLIVLSDKDAEE